MRQSVGRPVRQGLPVSVSETLCEKLEMMERTLLRRGMRVDVGSNLGGEVHICIKASDGQAVV